MFLLKIISEKIEAIKEKRDYRRLKRRANSRKSSYYYLKQSHKRFDEISH